MTISMKHFFTLITLLFFSFSICAQKVDHVLGEILIKPMVEKDLKPILTKYTAFNGESTEIKNKRIVSKNVDIYLIEFDFGKIDEELFLRALKDDPLIEDAQYNHLVKMRATPNDPFLNQQWHWINSNDADVDADLAWDIATGGLTTQGDEIVVAVLDDGTDLTHPDLQANHWVNTAEIPNNNIDDDNNGYVDDYNGWSIVTDDDNVSGGSHGVNVNGMIGAVGNDGNQGTGINWNVKIMVVKNNFNTNEAAVLEAYDYPLTARKDYNDTGGTKGAYVVATNASWGIDGGDPDDAPLWCAFYDTLGAEGILNCGATTNSNNNVDVVGDLPTTCPSDFMVAVTRTDDEDDQFGGFGPIHIDVGAPGQGVYTAAAGGGYTTTTGTSFASPLTAGIIALMYSVPCDDIITLSKTNPGAAALQMRDYLYDGVDQVLPGLVSTDGRVNAFNSCQLIVDDCGPCTDCPTCDDGIQNQNETEIDCGGPFCDPCPPSCTDGIQNQDETGIDCGGSLCGPCPTCSDGILNQDETEIDCGGSLCDPCPCLGTEVTLTIILDNYPEETSWAITDATSVVVASGGTYGNLADGSTFTEDICLADGCYDFTIEDSYGDGICCQYGNGSYNLTNNLDATVLATGGDFDDSEVTNFCVTSPTSNCDAELTLSGNMASISKTENASNTINSTEIINTNSDVTYEAGSSIQLDPGFEVEANSQFLAQIASCTSTIISNTTSYELIASEGFLFNHLQDKKAIAISYDVDSESNITIVVTDDFGNVVKSQLVNKVQKGSHQQSIDISDLQFDGSYRLVVLKMR